MRRVRAGRLATRRYKVRRRKMGWLLLIAGISLGFGASAYLRFLQPLPQTHISVQPAPTLPPEETQADERTVTLAAQSWYALQIGVFDDASAAGQEADALRARGAGGYIFRKDGCRLLAAAYTARADAQAVMSRLKTRHGLSTEIVEIVSPEITLRLSGQKGQLTALTDAFSAMEKLCGHLYQLSLSLDRQETKEDIERQFGINHLGHFLLTTLLLDWMPPGSRIVNVASGAHKVGKIHFDDINLRHGYNVVKAYSQSKLANVLFTRELAARLKGRGITVNCCHPGAVATNMGVDRETRFGKTVTGLLKPFFLTPAQGAATAIYLASDEAVAHISGGYFYKCRIAKSSKRSKSRKTARRLYELSEELVRGIEEV